MTAKGPTHDSTPAGERCAALSRDSSRWSGRAVTTPADPLEPDPTAATNVGASLPTVGLRRIVVRSAAGHECDQRQGGYEGGEHAHRRPRLGEISVHLRSVGIAQPRRVTHDVTHGDFSLWITSAKCLARPEGLEPPTPRFVVWCSIQLSYGRKQAAGCSGTSAAYQPPKAGSGVNGIGRHPPKQQQSGRTADTSNQPGRPAAKPPACPVRAGSTRPSPRCRPVRCPAP
jgi:hypothetical protein